MSKTEQLDSLFIQWRKEYPGQKFAEDGIIDENLWDRASRKILFLFKDTNNYGGDLRIGVEKGWKEIEPWAYGLINTTADSIPSFNLASNAEHSTPARFYTALMNLKKVAGGASADMCVIGNVALKDKEFILKELGIIQPNIIICGGNETFAICEKIFTEWKFDAVGPDKRCYLLNNIVWIRFCHYNARFDHDLRYYGLMNVFQNALKIDEVSKLLSWE